MHALFSEALAEQLHHRQGHRNVKVAKEGGHIVSQSLG